MKLDNKGWGTIEMILLSLGLLIALLVSIYYIGKLYGSLQVATGKSHYIDLESKLEIAAKEYTRDYNINIIDRYIINYDTLKKAGYINDLRDSTGKSCNGYVIINVIDNNKLYAGYINCEDYKTANY